MFDIEKEQRLYILQLCEILTRLVEKSPTNSFWVRYGEYVLDLVDAVYLGYTPLSKRQAILKYIWRNKSMSFNYIVEVLTTSITDILCATY